jgi:hypothetical protein
VRYTVGCFAFLLRVRTALVEFHAQWKDDPAFPTGLKVLGDMSFWKRLKNAEFVIRPLSFASYKLQRDENTVADAVYCFGWIFRGFAKSEDHRDALELCREALVCV